MREPYRIPALQSFKNQKEFEIFVKNLLAHRDNDWFHRLNRPMIKINVETSSMVIGNLCVDVINGDPKIQAILQHLNEQSSRVIQTLEKMQNALQPIFDEYVDGTALKIEVMEEKAPE